MNSLKQEIKEIFDIGPLHSADGQGSEVHFQVRHLQKLNRTIHARAFKVETFYLF